MKIVNGYPVQSASGTIWIVQVDAPIVIRETSTPEYAYSVDDEDEAIALIESGTVDNPDWQVEHEQL